jgi:Fic family protein
MQLMYIDLDRRVAQYRAHRLLQPHAWRAFEERLQLSWLFHDYALEGIALTEDDLQRATQHAPARHHCDSLLIEGIRQCMQAIEVVCRLPRKVEPMELEDLKHFHVLLCPQEDPRAGRYRKQDDPSPPYSHEITKPVSISYRLRRLVELIQTDLAELHPVRGAALLHHEFMSIWPFGERCGTAGRLLMNHWLLRADYPPAILHAADRHLYYQALEGPAELMIPVVHHALDATLRCAEGWMRRQEHQIA